MTTRSGSNVLSESAPPKVLLVDDESTGRRLLRRWIERCFDGQVVEASNGMEALEALAAEQFDLVVLDLMMPVLDGTETLSLIRSDPSHGSVEVVIASQVASEQRIKDVIALGVADYILKPLRYQAVVDRLRQIIDDAREKKKARQPQGGLYTILIADPDPNFCDFAVSALAGRFNGISARTAAETLVGVHKNEPHLVMLSPALPGLPFEILGKKVLALTKAHGGKVCLLTETRSDSIDSAFAGQVLRNFVPESLSAEVAKLLAGAASGGGQGLWLKALEPEITSAVRQAIGMTTGIEPTASDRPPADFPADLFAVIELQACNEEVDLLVDLHCQRPFAVALCTAMLGGEAADVDDELLMSGIGEILNVIAGRIKNSCAKRKIEVTVGLPQLHESPLPEKDAFYRWEQHFVWQGEHRFRLGVTGARGTPAEEPAGTASQFASARSAEVASPSVQSTPAPETEQAVE